MGLSSAVAIPLGMQGLGMVTSILGGDQAGRAARARGLAEQQAADYQAGELTREAGYSRAVASQAAADTDLNIKYKLSDLRAHAAASGGGVTNPTVTNLASGIAGRGEYDVLAQLYSGEERARGLESQAALARYTGRQQALAGEIAQRGYGVRALSTVLSGGGTMFSKYGGGGYVPPEPDQSTQYGSFMSGLLRYPNFDYSQAG